MGNNQEGFAKKFYISIIAILFIISGYLLFNGDKNIKLSTVDTSSWKTYSYDNYQISYPSDASVRQLRYPDSSPQDDYCIHIRHGLGYIDIYRHTSNPCNGSEGYSETDRAVKENVVINGKVYNANGFIRGDDNSFSSINFSLNDKVSVGYGVDNGTQNKNSTPLSNAEYTKVISDLKTILSTLKLAK